MFSETWPRSFTMRSGIAFRRPTWVPPTSGTGSSFWHTVHGQGEDGHGSELSMQVKRAAEEPPLWPTPDAGNFNDGQSLETYQARKERELAKGYNGNGGGTPLAMAVQLAEQGRWPTPAARDWKSSASNLHDENARPLNEVVRKWSTPNNADAVGGPGRPDRSRKGENLREQVAQAQVWSTPQARDGDRRTRSVGGDPERHGGYNLGDQVAAETPVRGALNPEWVEALQGLPRGWTDIGGPLPRARTSTRGSRPGPSAEGRFRTEPSA
jgi:hypothetical protein